MIYDRAFEGKLNQKELAAWKSFVKAVKGFFGNKKNANHIIPIKELLQLYFRLCVVGDQDRSPRVVPRFHVL